jgi:hypothetical protein
MPIPAAISGSDLAAGQLEDAICEFVLARAEECANEFGPISNTCWTWSDWAHNYCGGPDRIGQAAEALNWAWARA